MGFGIGFIELLIVGVFGIGLVYLIIRFGVKLMVDLFGNGNMANRKPVTLECWKCHQQTDANKHECQHCGQELS